MTEDFIDMDEYDPHVAQAVEDRKYEARKATDDHIAAHIRRSKEAYTAVFVKGDATPDDVDFVMRDLQWFARTDTQYFSDARLQEHMAGRKAVLQRIFEYSKLDMDTLTKRYMQTQN